MCWCVVAWFCVWFMIIASTIASITIMIANISKCELARCGARRTGQIHFPLVADSVWRNDKSLLYKAESLSVGDRFSLA